MSTRCHVLLAVALVGLVVPTGVTSVGGAAGATDAAGDTQVDGVNVLRTHPSTDLGTFDDVVNASSAETLERSEVAVPGDVLVVRLDQAGLGQSIGNATGETATERFRSWLEREDTSLSFAPTDGSGPTLDSNGAGVTLRSGFAYGDNRTYLVVQTGVAMADDRTLSALSGLNYRFSAQDGNATVQSDPVSFVEPSVNERTAIRVVAYRSREGIEEGERLYRDGAGDPVAVTLTLDPSATPELTHTPETPPPTAMPTDDEVPEPGTTVAADATGGDGAGFGLLTSLAALSGLAWLARRR
jgi:hypothetical protein